jgi:hypothetical protein
MKRYIASMVVALASLVVIPTNAMATCTVIGYVDGYWLYGGGSDGGNVFVREGSLSDHVYYFGMLPSTAPEVVAVLSELRSSRKRVRIIGDAAACPETGGSRSGGDITSSSGTYIELL